MYTAVKLDVPVHLTTHYDALDGTCCVFSTLVNAAEARCGNPLLPVNDDELAIRGAIEKSGISFDRIDTQIECVRISGLETFGRLTGEREYTRQARALLKRLPQTKWVSLGDTTVKDILASEHVDIVMLVDRVFDGLYAINDGKNFVTEGEWVQLDVIRRTIGKYWN